MTPSEYQRSLRYEPMYPSAHCDAPYCDCEYICPPGFMPLTKRRTLPVGWIAAAVLVALAIFLTWMAT